MYTASWALRRPARLGAGVRGRLRGAGATDWRKWENEGHRKGRAP